MAGTHEQNMKDPVWLTEQLKQAKAQRDALQEKHDAQLKGIEADKATIASLNDLVADFKKRFAETEALLTDYRDGQKKLSGDLELLRNANGDLVAQVNDLSALAKSRKAALVDVLNDANAKHAALVAKIAPLLAAE